MAKVDKKAKVLIIAIVLVIMMIVGLVPAFLTNYNTYMPNKPVVFDDGENTFISTTYNDNYVGYKFKLISADNNEIIIESDDNIINEEDIEISGGVLGQTYHISVCLMSQNVGNNSRFSESTEWIFQKYLTPTILSYEKNENRLTWNQVENADFYRVYFNDANDENYIDTVDLSLDLSTFDCGQKEMYVVACSNNKNFRPSNKSNTLEFDLKYYLSEFSNLSFDAKTKVLSAESNDILKEVKITLDGRVYLNNKFDVQRKGEKYIYSINLTAIYNGETIIGIRPVDIDEFNVFEGNTKTIDISQ